MAERIQRRRTKGWKLPEGAVIVMRPGIFGNPFIIQQACIADERLTEWMVSTESAAWFKPTKVEAAALAVELYRAWINHPAQASLKAKATLLRGKDLCCSCPLDQACHADVLIELSNR